MNDAVAIADRLVRDIGPKTVLDLGREPVFSELLRLRGVDVTRVDDVAGLAPGHRTDRVYDLVLCVGIPGGLGGEPQWRSIVALMCQGGRDVIFVPTSDEPRSGGSALVGSRTFWAELFAEQGFVFDVDFEPSFVDPVAMRFRRLDATKSENVVGVAQELADLRGKLAEKDQLILRLTGRLVEIQGSVAWKVAAKLDRGFARLLRAESDRIGIYGKLRRTLEVLVDEGFPSVFQRTRYKVRVMLEGQGLGVRPPTPGSQQAAHDLNEQYAVWRERHRLTDADLGKLGQAVQEFAYRPLVSIVTPVYETDEILLRKAIDSVRAQVYSRWELCLVNDGSRKPHVRAVLDECAAGDTRIRVSHLTHHEGIAEASARALAMTTGEFVGLLNHDDEVTPDALYEVVSLLNQHRELDLIYSDEDRIDSEGRRSEPRFKPEWSPDLLFSENYIAHFAVLRRGPLLDSGGFRPGFNGSRDYDLLLRVTERTDKIGHVPKILYHWRKNDGSAAKSESTKLYADKAAQRAVEDALERRGLAARVEGLAPGRYRIRYALHGTPMVSIIIPTRDRWDLLRQCIESIETTTDHPRYEIIVLDNDSVERGTLEYLETVGRKHRVLRSPGPFNFATINNLGAEHAIGDHLLFLNNDVRVAGPDWLGAMLEHSQRPEVGAVGAKLLYPDGRTQHAGLVLGVGAPAIHAFRRQASDEPGDHGLRDVVRDCSAVTGACIMVRRRLFEEIGRFDTRFRVAYGDLDLCLRLRARGHLVVYTPFAVLYHYESATRGHLHPWEDEALCWKLWGDVIRRGDPYYNPNLTRVREDWSLDLTR